MNLPASLDQRQRSAWRVALLAWVLLIVLGLAWELWLAPLRPGGSWLAFKVLPLVLLSAPLLRASTYAMQLALMLVLVYVFEGATRLLELPPTRWLAATELLLALVFFVAAIVYLRPFKRAAMARRAATGELQ
jgi:uncharacterized membrane protein